MVFCSIDNCSLSVHSIICIYMAQNKLDWFGKGLLCDYSRVLMPNRASITNGKSTFDRKNSYFQAVWLHQFFIWSWSNRIVLAGACLYFIVPFPLLVASIRMIQIVLLFLKYMPKHVFLAQGLRYYCEYPQHVEGLTVSIFLMRPIQRSEWKVFKKRPVNIWQNLVSEVRFSICSIR